MNRRKTGVSVPVRLKRATLLTVMTVRQRSFVALLAAVAGAIAAAAGPAAGAGSQPVLRVRVTGWTATLVNAERLRTGPHGTLRLCQAIPVTGLTVHLRHAGARPGTRLRLRVRAPGHAPRVRRLRLTRRAGTAARTFTPRGLGLRAGAFEEGRLVLRVVRGGRPLATASVRFAGAGTC